MKGNYKMITVKEDTSVVKFTVDEANKRVVCVITGCANIPVKRINRYSKHIMTVNNTKRYKIADEYVGIAKCHEKDTFDVSIGKKIALTKAKMKRANAVNRMINKFMSDTDKIKSTIADFAISRYDA